MKQLLWFLAPILLLATLGPSSRGEDKREPNPRFKGVELYSWKDGAGNWNFVLLDGTNRLKTEQEVKGARNLLQGVQELKKALGRLAVNEQVAWTHPIQGFAYPPAALRQEINQAAQKAKINLNLPEKGVSPRK